VLRNGFTEIIIFINKATACKIEICDLKKK